MKFQILITSDCDLSLKELWPDGNAPDNPTVEDVEYLIEHSGGPATIIEDWNLPVSVEVNKVEEK